LKTQLVCTFVRRNQIDKTLDTISDSFTLLNNKVFLLKSLGIEPELILSYNVILDSHKQFLPGSILVHRKKETNTIYTINALNDLIMTLNNGILDKTYPIEWDRYTDMMLSKKPDGLKMTKIQIIKTYSI
jgi:hypothetical protein